jgi:hypothetical protein
MCPGIRCLSGYYVQGIRKSEIRCLSGYYVQGIRNPRIRCPLGYYVYRNTVSWDTMSAGILCPGIERVGDTVSWERCPPAGNQDQSGDTSAGIHCPKIIERVHHRTPIPIPNWVKGGREQQLRAWEINERTTEARSPNLLWIVTMTSIRLCVWAWAEGGMWEETFTITISLGRWKDIESPQHFP